MMATLATPDEDGERYRAALLGSRLGLWDWSMQTGEAHLNERWAEIAGYTLEDLQPISIDTWTRLAHPDDLGRSTEEIERHSAGLTPFYDVELRMRHRLGHWVWVHDRGHIVEWSPDGQPSRMVGTHEDITDRVLALEQLAASERRFAAMFQHHDAVMLLVDPGSGEIVDANASALRFYGYTADAMRSMNIDQINTLPPAEIARRRAEAVQGNREYFVFPHRLASGAMRTVEVHSSRIEDHGRTLLFSIIRDVTEREVYETQLRQAAAVFENISEGVILSDNSGAVLRVNPAFTRLTGWAPDAILGRHARAIASPIAEAADALEVRMKHRQLDGFRGELSIRHADGTDSPSMVGSSPITGPMGEPIGFVTLLTDISEHVLAEQDRLERVARQDPVTGLPNAVRFQELVAQHLDQLTASGTRSALLLLDLDRFQAINDSFGRDAGDEVLACIGERLAGRLRSTDVLAVVHGNEFALLLGGISDRSHANVVAQDLLRAISPVITLADGQETYVSACIGVKLLPGVSRSPQGVIQNAEAALHEAKRSGPGTIRMDSAVLVSEARDQANLESRVRKAWDNREFRIAYQPQVDVATGAIVGAEALLRWTPADGEPCSPSLLVSVAERIGLISAIGDWVILEACRQGRAWLDAGLPPLTLAVNVSARQLVRGDLPRTIARALDATGFPADRLEIELTESALLQAGAATSELLTALTSGRVRLSIDDFGTGYSSFAYLKRFPLDQIKIDRSFVEHLETDPDDRAITSAIIAMAHALDCAVLAEGVETPGQLDILRDLACDLFQGYLVSPAADPTAFEGLLRRFL